MNAIQDLIPNNLCFGCGADNNLGLHIKSYWQDDESVCIYQPEPHQTAGPAHLKVGSPPTKTNTPSTQGINDKLSATKITV